MRWVQNTYYSASVISEESRQVIHMLLCSYPLTKACMEILGQQLVDKLELGFFMAPVEIIREGDAGKDMYLLCQGAVEVLVKDQHVVDMEGPVLLGDKALIEPRAKRAATLRLTSNKPTLVLKIPVGTFLHDFKAKLHDDVYVQELRIFSSIFHVIQQRLFEYTSVQKDMWEEVSTILKHLNTQMLIRNVETQREMEWDTDTWEQVNKIVQEKFQVSVLNGSALSVGNLRKVLFSEMERQYPVHQFKGPDARYQEYRKRVWLSWLQTLSESLLKTLPADQLPLKFQEGNLFNPSNYHTQIVKELRKIEAQLSSSSASGTKKTSLTPFFGKWDRSHEFDLSQYLEAFESNFRLSRPKRTQGQIAQRLALIAARCENLFNNSVAKMQHFLTKTRQHAQPDKTKKNSGTGTEGDIQRYVETLLKGLEVYRKRASGSTTQQRGKIQFNHREMPTGHILLNDYGVEKMRDLLFDTFHELLTTLDIGGKCVSEEYARYHLYLCEVPRPGDEVWPYDLETNYWVPLQPTTLIRNKDVMGVVKAGCLIGGEAWKPTEDDPKPPPRFSLRNMQTKPTLMLVLPQKAIPWLKSKQHDTETLKKDYLPMMQWLVTQHVEQLVWWVEQRDLLFQRRIELEEVVRIETKISALEKTHERLDRAQHARVAELLLHRFAIKVDPERPLYWDQLARKIYHSLITQINRNNPDMSMDERGNKAYTEWRYVLSEVVNLTESLDGTVQKTPEPPTVVFEVIVLQLRALSSTYLENHSYDYSGLLEEAPSLKVAEAFSETLIEDPIRTITFFQQILRIFTSHLQQVTKDTHILRVEVATLNQQRPQVDSEEGRTALLREQVNKLVHLLRASK